MIRILLLFLVIASGASAERLRLVSTSTTENSRLMAAILPKFEAASGLKVDLLVTGTGQALRIGAKGDGDVLLVHDPEGEKAFVAEGHGAGRFAVMENFFLLVGPESDPAGLRAAKNVSDAFERLALSEAIFVSRGDDSGTHRAERRMWENVPNAAWYRETGAGMGATLNIAAELGGYTMVDLGSWVAFGNKGDLTVLFEDSQALRNPYSLIPVAPNGRDHVNSAGAAALLDWMLSKAGQKAIGDHEIRGQKLFCPAHFRTELAMPEWCSAAQK